MCLASAEKGWGAGLGLKKAQPSKRYRGQLGYRGSAPAPIPACLSLVQYLPYVLYGTVLTLKCVLIDPRFTLLAYVRCW